MGTFSIQREHPADTWDIYDRADGALIVSTHDTAHTLQDLALVKLDEDGWNALGAVVMRRIRETEGAAQEAAEHITDVQIHGGRFRVICGACPFAIGPFEHLTEAMDAAQQHGTFKTAEVPTTPRLRGL